MDQNKIGKYIKELRIENNLSQGELANKLAVTKQAISKWENGRGIPDIEMLRKLSDIFNVNIDDLINGKKMPKSQKDMSKHKYIVYAITLTITAAIAIVLLVNIIPKDNFEFNSIASDNDKFSIKGVIASNKNKKSIYISDIKYSAPDSEQEEYVVAECILYETVGNIEKRLSQCGDISNHKNFDSKSAKTLSNLLKDVEFNIDNYSCSCGSTHCNNLYLRVNAININNKTITYNIPIQVDNKCEK